MGVALPDDRELRRKIIIAAACGKRFPYVDNGRVVVWVPEDQIKKEHLAKVLDRHR